MAIATAPPEASEPSALHVWFGVLRAAVTGWIDDGASSMGAALSYYTALSLAPLLLVVMAVAGLLYGEAEVGRALISQFQQVIGKDGAEAIRSILENASRSGEDRSILSIVMGAALLLIGATTVFAELQADLDRIWKAEPKAGGGLWRFLRVRLLSFGLVVSVGFLLLVSLVATAVIAAIGESFNAQLKGFLLLASILNTAVSLAIITVLFALIYKLLPSRPIAWSDVWMGAFVTSVLFSLGKYGIGLYLGTVALSSSFGAAGAFVVLMVWIYYAAQVFLLGAEFTYHYAVRHGSLQGDDATMPQAAKA